MSGIMPVLNRDRSSKFGFVIDELEWLRGQIGDTFMATFAEIPVATPYHLDQILTWFQQFLDRKAPFSTFLLGNLHQTVGTVLCTGVTGWITRSLSLNSNY